VAELWLRLKGYAILARRYRTRWGEIDLIGRRGRVVVFAEVKARAAIETAAEAITPAQQRRIVAAARGFLAGHPALAECDIRFDAILVEKWRAPHHIVDAWRPVE